VIQSLAALLVTNGSRPMVPILAACPALGPSTAPVSDIVLQVVVHGILVAIFSASLGHAYRVTIGPRVRAAIKCGWRPALALFCRHSHIGGNSLDL